VKSEILTAEAIGNRLEVMDYGLWVMGNINYLSPLTLDP
jgi:hypothetical protein